MKPIRNLMTATLLAGAVLAGAGTSLAVAADDATTDQTPPPGPHGWHHRGGPGASMHMLGKLGLNEQQKQQVKDIMTAARPQMQALHEQMHANMQKLEQTQPTDPNYSSIASQVSQTHGSLSAQMLTQHAEIRAQIFKVLTPAQQAQLATLEAQMKSRKPGAWGGAPPAQQ
jgi:periplasmic protein CpxP/Spy